MKPRERADILHELRRLLAERLGLEPSTALEIDENQPLFDGSIGLDSVDALELVVAVEQTFGVAIPSEIIGSSQLGSLAQLASYLGQLGANVPGAPSA